MGEVENQVESPLLRITFKMVSHTISSSSLLYRLKVDDDDP
jgi:hypothetical protein